MVDWKLISLSTISVGKYGSFAANALLGRPYNLTFEIVESSEMDQQTLRIVSAAELHTEALTGEVLANAGLSDGRVNHDEDGVDYDLDEETGEAIMRSNREIVDDPSRQKLSLEEIEALKREGAGRDIIARLMESHSGISLKTNFSLAKYTLRKARKYMRRFTVLPLDVSMLARWMLAEKDPVKIMEMREDMLSLMCSWANVRWSTGSDTWQVDDSEVERGRGRWLVVDDTGGLVVAAVAERMGILYRPQKDDETEDVSSSITSIAPAWAEEVDNLEASPKSQRRKHKPAARHIPAMTAISNTITVVHANNQPNLSLLKYFLFDTSNPSLEHPMYAHLKSLSWLQLLSPEEDSSYAEPEHVSDEVLQKWKPGRRTNYFRKRRRWERVKRVVDETRGGGFDGLIVCSTMNPVTILQHTVPLLRGSAQVVVYSPYIEPLAELADLYSTARRTAYLSDPPDPATLPNDDFPLNPTLLLAPSVQTTSVQSWQCLPGRTHPLMTSRGGAEGYLFTATRVLPAEGKVEARGNFKKRKLAKPQKVAGENGGAASAAICEPGRPTLANGDAQMGSSTAKEAQQEVMAGGDEQGESVATSREEKAEPSVVDVST